MSDLSLFDLTGKKALVTGAASGIGRASAIGMAKAGADVAVVDMNEEMGQKTVADIKKLGRESIFVKCDVTSVEQVADMVKRIVSKFGRLDIAHNNAGISGPTGIPTISDEALELWRILIDTDLNSVFYCCREEGKVMIPQKYGSIINTASISGTIINNMEVNGIPAAGVRQVGYCTAKAGVKHLTKALAMDWVHHKIRVNSISPGVVNTPLIAPLKNVPGLVETRRQSIPMHREGEVNEIVGGIIYLASDASSFATGMDLIMDGGQTVW